MTLQIQLTKINTYFSENGDATSYALAELYSQYAELWLGNDRHKKSIEYYNKALVIYDVLYPDTPCENRARCHLEVGQVWRLLGDNKKTGGYFQKALAEFKSIHSDTPHTDIARTLFLLGSFLEQIWKLTPALSYYKEAHEQLLSLLGDTHTHTQACKAALLRISGKKPT